MPDKDQTTEQTAKFDFRSYPDGSLFHDRRLNSPRRRSEVDGNDQVEVQPLPGTERRAKKERRRRIDPTTFEKQYTEEEMEFMNAMQHYKVQTGKPFPTHGEVLKVALALGYRKIEPPTG